MAAASRQDAAVPASARFLVCVPTYDERENLERMVEALAAVRERRGDAATCS